PSQESLEWLAARVFEHEHGPPLVLGKRERSHSPDGIEIGPQGVFMLEPPEATQCGVCRDRGHDEDRRENSPPPAPGLPSVKDELPVLTKRLEQVGCKVHHGGPPCYTRACSEVEDEPGQARRVVDDESGSRRAMPT